MRARQPLPQPASASVCQAKLRSNSRPIRTGSFAVASRSGKSGIQGRSAGTPAEPPKPPRAAGDVTRSLPGTLRANSARRPSLGRGSASPLIRPRIATQPRGHAGPSQPVASRVPVVGRTLAINEESLLCCELHCVDPANAALVLGTVR